MQDVKEFVGTPKPANPLRQVRIFFSLAFYCVPLHASELLMHNSVWSHSYALSSQVEHIIQLFHYRYKIIFFAAKELGKIHRFTHHTHTHTTTILRSFFRDHPGEPVPEENFWTLWCKGRFTEADTLTIRLGTTPCGLTIAHLHHPPHIFTGRMPFLPPNQQCQSTEGN